MKMENPIVNAAVHNIYDSLQNALDDDEILNVIENGIHSVVGALVKENEKLKFNLHLAETSNRIQTWPEWKQALWGPSDAMKAAMKEIERLEAINKELKREIMNTAIDAGLTQVKEGKVCDGEEVFTRIRRKLSIPEDPTIQEAAENLKRKNDIEE